MNSISVVVFALFVATSATNVQQCPDHNIENLSDNVQLTPCKKPPCKLKQGTDQHISIKFTPDKDIKSVKNSVQAEVFGVPLPFVGVDGASICDKIFSEDGEKATCPLKAGTTYVYKDSFHIYDIYPRIEVKVKWALQHGEHDLMCFTVPAKIVQGK